MAVHLEATYAKKLGLPNYSSHQYAVTIRTELNDLSQVEAESAKLYRMLQDAVDKEIVEVGYMPDATVYGMNRSTGAHSNGNGNGNGSHRTAASSAPNNGDRWNMTDGQKGLILRIINENQLSKQDVEDQAQQLFGIGVRELDKMQASQLIEELLEKVGKKPAGQRRWSRQPART